MFSLCNLEILKKSLSFDAQPIVSSASGRVIGHELLARLSIDGDVLSPDFFIPILVDSGFYFVIDEMLATCASDFLDNADDGFVSINIQNINSLLFHLSNPVYCGLESRVHFELLESVEWSGVETMDVISAAAEKGFRVYLDDFGAGLSNIRTVVSDSLYGVKIDRCVLEDFMSAGCTDSLSLLVDFLLSRNKEITFEGVETVEQECFIKSLGVSVYLQGYLYGKPKKVSEV